MLAHRLRRWPNFKSALVQLSTADTRGSSCYPLRQGERTKFDRFVDPNVRGAKRRVYSDIRIYCN